jgi:hypothetical protein
MRTDISTGSPRRGHPWAELRPADPPVAATSSFRRLAVLASWIALLIAVLVGFIGLGHDAMAAPDLTDPGSWAGWADARTAPEAAFAIVRLGVLVVAGYLLLVTVLALAATVWHGRGLLSVVEILTFPAVRRVVQAMVGVSMAGASIAAVGAGSAPLATPPTAADVQLARVDHSMASAGGAEVMYRLPAQEADGAPVMRLLTPDVGAAVGDDPEAAADVEGTEWLVEPGDHLWSIAQRVLGESGEDPTDASVAAYSAALVEANHDRLADVGNPDLLFPGQSLRLPAPPDAPGAG